ncbi:ribonuclease HII [Mycoplasmopsis sturni]|uniref:ribonuclease HII n=1 Tax=Mycoplasmopsis sturni TaxID=39047 RepID=UPI00055B49DC|nr:ribonuclease HII [Mycoplasmopsis sturni]
MLKYETENLKDYKLVAGCDEAGRGAWAGPLVAACVIMDMNIKNKDINDSKKLTPSQREDLYKKIIEEAIEVQIYQVDVDTLNNSNPKKESQNAMSNCVQNFKNKPQIVLTDFEKIQTEYPQINLVKGDQISYNIAAASIVAKVYRDKLMTNLAVEFPEYGFQKHKGYGTKFHQEALSKFGVTKIHRIKYKPISKILHSKMN